MKRGITILTLSILLILPIITATDISTCQELQDMQLNLADDYSLTADIPCSGFTFTPVTPFTGTFDGGDFKITNLEINLPDTDEVGLFGSSSGTISNVILESISVKGHNSIGGLVGINTGTIQNCHVQGTIIADQGATPGSKVGGLAGQNKGTITKSSSNADVTGGYDNLGGLVGHQEATGIIRFSYASGDITGINSHIGGLVGRNLGTIENSYATGNAESTGDNDIGGLVGRNIGTITRSYAAGNAKGTTTSGFGERVGGLVGRLEAGGTLEHSYATGKAEGSLDVEGLIGIDEGGTVTNSYRHFFKHDNTDPYSLPLPDEMGIVEEDYTNFFSSTHPVYTGTTPWDFTTNWQIIQGQNYPYLQWQTKDINDGTCQSHEDCTISSDCSCNQGFDCIEGTCIQQLECSGTPAYQITSTEDCSDFYLSLPKFICSKASDGDFTTDWIGNRYAYATVPKWIYGDLGEKKCLSEIRVWNRGDSKIRYIPQTMNIQISNNAIHWKTIYPDWTIDKASQWFTLSIPEVKARYVRFWMTDCNHYDYHCNLWGCEWELDQYERRCNIREFEISTRPASYTCTPDCTNKECGSDGCTGFCPPGCTNPHGTTSCSQEGLCQPVCDQYWANCDGDNTNGCETDLRDPATCGTDCSSITSCTPEQFCSEGICTSPTSVYWANMRYQPIKEAQIGDTVLMIYTATDATTFEIREDDLIENDDIRTAENAITGNIIEDKAVAKFTITQEDFNKGFSDELDTDVEFFFQINTETSENLIVQKDSYSNSPPTVQLIKPTLDQQFKTQTNIDFEQIATDEDDDLKITWDFGDNSQETLTNCLTTTNCNTTHSYSNSGARIITLTAEEMTRSKKDTNSTRIFLFSLGTNIFPIITKPALGTIIQGTQTVDFDASNSYVAECSSTCPILLPYGITDCYNVDDLKCYDLDNTQGIPNDYNLWFNWTFSEGIGTSGNWNQDYNKTVIFEKFFFSPISHWAKLKLGYEPVE